MCLAASLHFVLFLFVTGTELYGGTVVHTLQVELVPSEGLILWTLCEQTHTLCEVMHRNISTVQSAAVIYWYCVSRTKGWPLQDGCPAAAIHVWLQQDRKRHRMSQTSASLYPVALIHH